MQHDGPPRVGVKSGDQGRLLFHAVIFGTMRAVLLRGARRTACLARAQIFQRSLQLARERLVAGDGHLRIRELLLEGLAHHRHGLRAVTASLPRFQERLDLVEREPGFLKELDPADPGGGSLVVETKAAAAARDRMEEVQLLVESKRPDRFTRLFREIADLEMFARRGFHRLPPNAHLTLTQTSESNEIFGVSGGSR